MPAQVHIRKDDCFADDVKCRSARTTVATTLFLNSPELKLSPGGLWESGQVYLGLI